MTKDLDSLIDTSRPYMTVSFDSEDGHSYRVLLVGDYEEYEDGNNVVNDVEPIAVERDGILQKSINEDLYPDDLNQLIESILDDKDTYIDMRNWHEESIRENA